MSETPRPNPRPGPRHAAPDPTTTPTTTPTTPPRRHTRRWFLAGTGAAVIAAGGGVGAAFLQRRKAPAPRVLPDRLAEAIRTERGLLADLDATTGGGVDVRRVVVQVRADHAAHLQALVALSRAYDAGRAEIAVRGTPRTLAELRAAELGASSRAASAAAGLDRSSARLATVLASIAACEATHAELLA